MPAQRKHPDSPPRTLLLGIASEPGQGSQQLADGVDLLDVSGDPLDADRLAAAALADQANPPERSQVAAVVAVAVISTWLGAPVIRTRHTRQVRRAIDMTESLAGRRPPALTTRGLG